MPLNTSLAFKIRNCFLSPPLFSTILQPSKVYKCPCRAPSQNRYVILLQGNNDNRDFSSFHCILFSSSTFLSSRECFYFLIGAFCQLNYSHNLKIVVAESPGRTLIFVTLRTATLQASLSFTISQSLLKFMSIELVMPSNQFVLCRPLLLLLSIFFNIRVFPMSCFFASGGQSMEIWNLKSKIILFGGNV